MIERLGHAYHETVDKVPEVGETFSDKTIMEVHEIYPSVYEIELNDLFTCLVEVVV